MQNKQVTITEFVKDEATKAFDGLMKPLFNINTPILEYLLELLSRIGHGFYYNDLVNQINTDIPDLNQFSEITDAVYDIHALLLGRSPTVREAYRDGTIQELEEGNIMEPQYDVSHEMLDTALLKTRTQMQLEEEHCVQNAIVEEQANSNNTIEQTAEDNPLAHNIEQDMANLNIDNHYSA